MRPSTTARRYAEAAFDVAREDGDLDRWVSELRNMSDMIQRPNVRSYFDNPDVSTDEKLATLSQFFPEATPHVLNLLRVLTSRHRVHLMPPIAAEFEQLVRSARGILEATVTVARPVTDAEREEIRQRLSGATGKQVEIETQVDPSIIGGVIVHIGDHLVDASIAGRLQRLRQNLAV